MADKTLDNLVKFCGIGLSVIQEMTIDVAGGKTLRGVMVKLIPSGIETPAMRGGFQYGDTILGLWKGRNPEYYPVTNRRQFHTGLGGMKGIDVTLDVLRRKPDGYSFKNIEDLERIQIRVTRDEIFPGAPGEDLAKEKVRWRTFNDRERCLAVSEAPADVTSPLPQFAAKEVQGPGRN